jgi:hypothetical protein
MTSSDEVTADLDRLLTAAADDGTRRYWERYLKGTASFRGVPMAGVRETVDRLWDQHALGERPVDELLSLGHSLFARSASEDKLAAVPLIAEHLVDRLRLSHHAALAQPLEAGNIADWGVRDWYAQQGSPRIPDHR